MRRALLATGVLVSLMIAGCSGPYAADLLPEKTAAAAEPEKGNWTFAAGSMDLLDTSHLANVTGSFKATGFAGAEPNIGITSDGSIFISAYDDVVTPVDERRWESVYHFDPENTGSGSIETGDPMLWVDPVTDIVYSNHMYPSLVCFTLAWSKDQGESWDENDASCTTPGVDHQKFFTAVPGPTAPPMAGDEHPTVLYQCYQRAAADDTVSSLGVLPDSGFMTLCNISYDGGQTWPAETTSAARLPGSCGGINGHPAGAPDGTIVVPVTRGCGGLYISVSTDSGLSWTVRPGVTSVGGESIDPDLTFTPDGTLYAIWRGGDHIPYLARSTDVGLTWDGPWRVAPPHITSSVFQVISSGDDGRIAMAFLGTDDTTQEPSFAPNETRWHLYIVTSENADAETPIFDAVQVTEERDPVQTGCVWLYGGGNPCRNMLDFIDSAAGPDGTFHVAFTKGCGAGCTEPEDKTSNAAHAWLEGWSLGGTQ